MNLLYDANISNISLCVTDTIIIIDYKYSNYGKLFLYKNWRIYGLSAIFRFLQLLVCELGTWIFANLIQKS